MKTLHLTSPMMQGAEVRSAQNTLNGHNIFKRDFLKGEVDGVYGFVTTRASNRAKFWLGYRESDINGAYGEVLDDLLEGRTKQTEAMKAIAAKRKKDKADAIKNQSTLGHKALGVLKPKLGMTEDPPGSNICEISRWYGVTGPWCAMTDTYAFVKAGSKAWVKGSRFAYCPFLWQEALIGTRGIYAVRFSEVRAGDGFVVDWQGGDGRNIYAFDHTGLVRYRDGDIIGTREGNTSFTDSGNQSNGGALTDKTRDARSATFRFFRTGR